MGLLRAGRKVLLPVEGPDPGATVWELNPCASGARGRAGRGSGALACPWCQAPLLGELRAAAQRQAEVREGLFIRCPACRGYSRVAPLGRDA